MRFLRLAVFCGVSIAASFLLAAGSDATPIGPTCGTCQGSIYELSYSGSPISTTATTETFQITYTIDTTGYTGPGTFLDAVALKVASSFIDATLVSAPTGAANWVEMSGGLANAGCTGSGSGFDCVMVASLVNAPVVPGMIYTWVFDIEVATGGLFTGVDEASVKARYVTANGTVRTKAGALVSEGITLTVVPEPRLALLLLLASPWLALRLRIRQH